MTLQASGAISLANLATEFALASSSPLSAFYGKGGAPASGALSLADFYGRSNAAPISVDNSNPTVATFNQSASAHITCGGGRTVSSITLIAGTANARIIPGSTGSTTATGSVNAPSSGSGIIDATYRYTCSTGEFVDVAYHGEWGT